MSRTVFLAALLIISDHAVEPAAPSKHAVAESTLREAALAAVFPGMRVVTRPSVRIDHSWPKRTPVDDWTFFPDAMADEPVYSVVGKARNAAEWTASENLETERFSETRDVRIKLFHWPRKASELVGVLQYEFAGANPSFSCPSIGIVVHLSLTGSGMSVRQRYLLEPSHHSALQRIELLDVTGDGSDDLIIESNFGGAGTIGSNLEIFDLANGRLDEVLNTISRLQYATDQGYTQTIDLGRSRQSRGQRICLTKTQYFENNVWLKPPRVTGPCFPAHTGVDVKGVKRRNAMLNPTERP